MHYLVTNGIEEPALFTDYGEAEAYENDMKKRWPHGKVELLNIEIGRPPGHSLKWAAYYSYDPTTKTIPTFYRCHVWQSDIDVGPVQHAPNLVIGYTLETNEVDALRTLKARFK